MSDEMDYIQEFNDQRNQDALDEHRRRMEAMETIEGEYECEDCGKPLKFLTKARLNAPVILCGECSDYYSSKNLGKFRGEY